MQTKTRNKTQQKSYNIVCKTIQHLAEQWKKNKNGASMGSVTISAADAEKAMIADGELITGIKVGIKCPLK